MASIRDVAVRAGVGIGTVSRALNGTGYISEETKKKIMEAVEELGYRPNELAQNLYHNRSGIIGVMVPDLEHPFFAALMKQIQTNLYYKGYKCIVGDIVPHQDRQSEFLELLQRNAIDGLISCVDPSNLRDVDQIQKPIVVLDRDWGNHVVSVHSDHRKGGQLAAQALLSDSVHRVLIFRPDCSPKFKFMERYTAFEEICREKKIEISYVNIPINCMGYKIDFDAVWNARELLREVDGVYGSDIHAAAALRIAYDMGIRVPEELKIVGYDGTTFRQFLHPQITTVAQDVPKLAKTLTDSVAGMIQGKKQAKEIVVPVTLLQGDTV